MQIISEQTTSMQSHKVDDRRLYPRTPFAGKAYLAYDGRCRCEEVADVSADGLRLSSRARLKPGSEVKVFLPLPFDSGYQLCLLKGTVVRRGAWGRKDLAISLNNGETDTRGLLAAWMSGFGGEPRVAHA